MQRSRGGRSGAKPREAWYRIQERRRADVPGNSGETGVAMVKFLLWLILLVLCWPLALLALVLYPLVWLILLPFRLVGIAVEGVLELIKALLLLPARILRGPARSPVH
jgi:hypothetical protein